MTCTVATSYHQRGLDAREGHDSSENPACPDNNAVQVELDAHARAAGAQDYGKAEDEYLIRMHIPLNPPV